MELFRDRRDRTVVLRLPRANNLYHRKDIIASLTRVIRVDNIEFLGQLESNLRWEVVLRDVAVKERLINPPKLPVGEFEATLEPLYHTRRQLRITRIPTCVPNEFITSILAQRSIKVIQITYHVDRHDGLRTNTRIATVTTDNWNNIPDDLTWELDGLRGTALLFLQGRPPRCYRCSERGHKFFECPYPFCTRCRRGHTADEICGLTYAQRTSGATARYEEPDEVELQGEEEDVTEQVTGEEDKPAEGAVTEASQNTEKEGEAASATPTNTAADLEKEPTAAAMSTDADSSDGDDGGRQETAPEASAESDYKQPREQRRRQRRTKKRAAASGVSATDDEQLKKRKDVAESESEHKSKSKDCKEPALDPTVGRRHSLTRIPTGRRKQ